MKNFLYLLILLIAPVDFFAQAPIASGKTAFNIPPDSGVLLLPALIRYEDIHTDALLDPSLHKGRETSEVFDSLAQRYLQNTGIRLTPASPADSIQSKLIAITQNLLRPIILPDYRAVLAAAAESAGCRYVLVCAVRVKIGPGGYWDPNSGSIGSSSSYARLRAALLDPSSADGKPCWTQEVEIRKLPQPHSNRFADAVRMLFHLLK